MLYIMYIFIMVISGKRDLNPRPLRWQRNALPLSYFRILQLLAVYILFFMDTFNQPLIHFVRPVTYTPLVTRCIGVYRVRCKQVSIYLKKG